MNGEIAYGFSDNNGCNESFAGQREEQLLGRVSASIRLWLSPLAEKQNIVDEFNYRKEKVEKKKRKFFSSYYAQLSGKKPDLAIIFYCEYGRSFMLPGGVILRYIQHASFAPPALHLYQRKGLAAYTAATDLHKYSLTTLLHELGHAFGLGDTYVEKLSSGYYRYGKSTGGLGNTTGKQPLSVMNRYKSLSIAPGGLKLLADDINGIKWLYDHHVEKKTKKEDCSADYVYEKYTKGCVPSHQLIHAVKEGKASVVKSLLKDDPSIDIDAKDDHGNTALHYAAGQEDAQSIDMYQYLLGLGADGSIKNNMGKSPRDLFRDNTGQEGIIVTILANLGRGQTNKVERLLFLGLKRKNAAVLEEFLVTGKFALNTQDSFGHTILHYAALRSHTKIIELLLRNESIDINKQDRKWGKTALHLAARWGHVTAVGLFLEHRNVDINRQSKYAGETALHEASRYGYVEVVDLLLAHKNTDINIEDAWGRTAYERAKIEKQNEILLLRWLGSNTN